MNTPVRLPTSHCKPKMLMYKSLYISIIFLTLIPPTKYDDILDMSVVDEDVLVNISTERDKISQHTYS